jgi:hypothetical protein
MPSAFDASTSSPVHRERQEKPGALNKSTSLDYTVMRSFRVAACFKTKLLPRHFPVFSIGNGGMPFTNAVHTASDGPSPSRALQATEHVKNHNDYENGYDYAMRPVAESIAAGRESPY